MYRCTATADESGLQFSEIPCETFECESVGASDENKQK